MIAKGKLLNSRNIEHITDTVAFVALFVSDVACASGAVSQPRAADCGTEVLRDAEDGPLMLHGREMTFELGGKSMSIAETNQARNIANHHQMD